MTSIYRPFGDVPAAESFTSATQYGTFSCALVVGTLILAHVSFLCVALARKYQQMQDRHQKNNYLIVLFSQVALLLGIVDVASSVLAYSSSNPNEPLFAQIFGCVSILGQIVLLIPALFLSPIYKGKLGDVSGKRVVIVVSVGITIILTGLEVGVIAKTTKTPVGLLYTIFSLQLASLSAMVGLGIYSIVKVAKDLHTIKKNDTSADIRAPNTTYRVTYLLAAIISIALYIVIHSMEGPMPLVMRGIEILSMGLILIVGFCFSWSILRSIASLEIEERVPLQSGQHVDELSV